MVTYSRPALGLSTLTNTLRGRYGNPARTYEFITGYGPGGITGHNADSNGVAHAVDIFVGPGNLTEAQGIDLAERLRIEGTKGIIPGHPDRLAYIIHRGMIAGDHTGWNWVQYNGTDPHIDHIHVSSVFDYYWGQVVAGNPADYDSTAPWDLWTSPAVPVPSAPTSIPTGSRKNYSLDDIHWIVDPGDTLTKIAAYYGIPGDVDRIAAYNGINPNVLRVGERIWIPGPLKWVVEAPDELVTIADYYGLDADYLARLNGLPNRWATIYVGNVLTIKN